jgi:hypothetical protein
VTTNEKELNILIHGLPTGTIDVRAHPEDVIDVDPEVLAVMKTRLRGESFDKMYGAEERVSREFLIQLEKKKLARVFASDTELRDAFSSLKRIKETRQALAYESVNGELLSEYTSKLSSGDPVDEVDVYRAVLFGAELRPKRRRLEQWIWFSHLSGDVSQIFGMIVDSYRETHFDVLGVSKELLQLQKPLRDYLMDGKLLPAVDEILVAFYKGAA